MDAIKIYIPEQCKYIIQKFNENGFQAFVVGGCVRDSLLGIEPKDWDITTSAKPEDTIRIFKELGYKIIETGIKHGTVTLLIDREPYEITTYRIEGEYENNRKPSEVEFTNLVEEDLKRRDFTINAMAYNDIDGLKDLFGGKADLEKKVLRCVGNPKERFQEDGLRMLRAVRFSNRLRFKIDEDTRDAIIEKSQLLKNISKERIREEFNKIILSDNPGEGMIALMECGLMRYIIPQILGISDIKHTVATVEKVSPLLELRLAALLYKVAECNMEEINHNNETNSGNADKVLKELKYDNKTRECVVKLIKEGRIIEDYKNRKNIKKLLGRIGTQDIFKLIEFQKAYADDTLEGESLIEKIKYIEDEIEDILEKKEPIKVGDLKIGGKDIIGMGIKPGKEIGNILNELLERCLDDCGLNTKECLEKIVMEVVSGKDINGTK